MERRGFLKGLTAGTVGWVVAGPVVDAVSSLVPAYADQVRFIGAAEAAGLNSSFTVNPTLTAARQAQVYPQSVAAGDPNPHGCVIWTRIDPSVTSATTAFSVGWQIATSDSFAADTIVVQGVSFTSADHDNTMKLPIQSAALKPFTIYYYRFIFHEIASRTGRFKTLPLPGDTVNQLRIGYVVCQDYSNGFYHAYGYLAQEDVDVVVFLGDYIYEYKNDGSGGANNAPVRVVPDYPSGASYPQGLADYRHLYQVYRADKQIQATHEKFAFIQLWDDHEFFNDSHQDFHEDTPNAGETATTPKPALRQAASQAWYEHGLAATPFNPRADWAHSIKVYRKFQFGTLADLVVTDERLHRDGPPCGDVITDRYQTTGCANVAGPTRTMLGGHQREWFIDAVTTSTATWKIWANEVMLAQYRVPTPTKPADFFEYFDLDQWDGYPRERADILYQIERKGVKNFVAISGDAHLYLTSYLKRDFNDLTQKPMGVEFMVGAVSSGNYLDALVDSPTKTPLPNLPAGASRAAQLGLPLDGLAPAVLAYNPHMVFWNGSTWGYAILTITPDSMICDYRVVSSVKTATATLQQLASFTVPVNQVKITQTV